MSAKSVRIGILRHIKEYTAPYKTMIITRGFITLFILAAKTSSPYLYKILIDDVLIGGRLRMLWVVCGGYLLLYAFTTLSELLNLSIDNRLQNKMSFQLRIKIWRNILNSRMDFSNTYDAGEIKNRIDADVSVFEIFIVKQVIEYLYNIGTAVAVTVVLAVINWKLALFGYIMIPVSFWMTKRLRKKLETKSGEYREEYGRYENWMANNIRAWKEIKALNAEDAPLKAFDAFWDNLSDIFFKRQLYWYGNTTIRVFKDKFVTHMNLYFIGGLMIFSGELTVGALLVFIAYFKKLITGINAINDKDIELANSKPSIDRVLEFLRIETVKRGMPHSLSGDISFRDVSFKYPAQSDYAVKNVSFDIRAGECVAIVGKSGHGKTTLTKLLLGLEKPEKGRVFIGGENISALPDRVLHGNIGAVMQDLDLFNLTIRENLLLAKAGATGEELAEACEMADIHGFIESLPEKYDTLIGEKGVKLSGGQRQRLGIARTLLASPSIMVLDESTSAVDNIAERKIYDALRGFSKNKTLIIIAHRLSSIVAADRVIVLKDGEIAGIGTHEELSGTNAAYDELFNY